VALAAEEAAGGSAHPARTAMLGGQELELEVLSGAPAPDTAIGGPAVVDLPESTLLVPPGWSGTVDAGGTIHLERRR
jgi:N-methylhydantoinase A